MKKMDKELEKLIEGMSRTQIELLASLFAGRAEVLAKKKSADSLKHWKRRNSYRWN